MDLQSINQLKSFLLGNFDSLKVLVFLSDSIEASKHYEETLRECLSDFEEAEMQLLFIKDNFPDYQSLFSQYQVDSVPCALVLNANFSVLDRLQNESPAELLLRQTKLSKIFAQNLELEKTKYKQTLNRVFANNTFILFEFLKPLISDYDECRSFLEANEVSFRRQSTAPFKEENLTTILAHFGIYFKEDAKAYSTHTPVVYFNKNIAFNSEDLRTLFKNHEATIIQLKENESNNLEKLLSNNKVVLFVNAETDDYQEKHNKILKALQTKKVMFSYLDIASKPVILSMLKVKSGRENLQLPVLVVEASHFYDQSELEHAQVTGFSQIVDKKYIIESVDDRIKLLLESNSVVLFIKGTPEFPQCGFTRQILEVIVGKGVKFGYYNIIADEELRERLKEYSNWKTYPQVYVNKELVGGLDIIKEMVEIGQFDEVFGPFIEK
jgi:Grx4 family monothiol glutaredoxin